MRSNPMEFPHVFVTTTPGLSEVLARLRTATKVAIDTETEVIDNVLMNRGQVGAWCVTSIAARYADGTEELYVVDMTDIDTFALAGEFATLVAYSWNANFERKVFESGGVDVARWDDLMLYQAVLDQGAFAGEKVFYTGLAAAAHQILGIDLEGKASIQLSYRRGVPLSEEQRAYAGQDAIVTLWLSDPIEAALERAELMATARRECDAQRFIDRMNQVGLPFDKEGWRNFLVATRAAADQALAHLADLTGGSEMTLFGSTGTPTWNLDSKADLARVLNQYEPERVRAYQETWGRRGATTFELMDTIDKDVLRLMGGEIATTIVEVRKHTKILETYGEKMLGLLGPDDRFHSRYEQALTVTGRLNAKDPNPQNQPPASKAFVKPHDPERVFVAGDFSQAELRLLAQMSQDDAMLSAFRDGKDLHRDTASRMFQVDMEALAASDSEVDQSQHDKLRKQAKPLNFGIAYGVGARKIAVGLTTQGVPTTPKEGKGLLERYLEVYPQVRAWLEARDQYVTDLSHNPGPIDWNATWDLYEAHKRYKSAYWKLRNAAQVTSDEAIAREVLGSRASDPETLAAATAEARWALSFKGPVVLRDRENPFSFESRTPAPGNRRRLFLISTDEWLTSMALIAGTSTKPEPTRLRSIWAAQNGVTLTARSGRPLGYAALKKVFEKRELKVSFVRFILEGMPAAAEYLMREALGDAIRGKKNEYRNHPIQGGVGDAVLEAFALLDQRLHAFHNAVPIQSVHDSIVIECDLTEAAAVRDCLVEAMTEAMCRYVRDLPVKVDAEILRSLDAKHDTIDEEEFLELVA